MPRIIDSNFLFGLDSGVSTSGNVTCEWCGKHYGNRENSQGEPRDVSESIAMDHLGNKQILECCFEEVENVLLQNMPKILSWYLDVLNMRKDSLGKSFGQLKAVKEVLRHL